jgi:hypothetical protein
VFVDPSGVVEFPASLNVITRVFAVAVPPSVDAPPPLLHVTLTLAPTCGPAGAQTSPLFDAGIEPTNVPDAVPVKPTVFAKPPLAVNTRSFAPSGVPYWRPTTPSGIAPFGTPPVAPGTRLNVIAGHIVNVGATVTGAETATVAELNESVTEIVKPAEVPAVLLVTPPAVWLHVTVVAPAGQAIFVSVNSVPEVLMV